MVIPYEIVKGLMLDKKYSTDIKSVFLENACNMRFITAKEYWDLVRLLPENKAQQPTMVGGVQGEFK